MIKKPSSFCGTISMWTNLTQNLVSLSEQLDGCLVWVFGLFTCLGRVFRTIEMIFDRCKIHLSASLASKLRPSFRILMISSTLGAIFQMGTLGNRTCGCCCSCCGSGTCGGDGGRGRRCRSLVRRRALVCSQLIRKTSQ